MKSANKKKVTKTTNVKYQVIVFIMMQQDIYEFDTKEEQKAFAKKLPKRLRYALNEREVA